MEHGASNGVAWVGALLLFGVWLIILSVAWPAGILLAVLIILLAI